MRKLTPFLLITTLLLGNKMLAQESQRTITTAGPFLLISGDARASGLGDQGVATPADAFSQQWNAAKYAFSIDKQGVALSYTPYLRELVADMNLGSLTYYNRINERSAFAGSLRYFSLGSIYLRETPQDIPREVKPNEFALDLSYALRLSDEFSMAVTGRYIRSQLEIVGLNGDASAANSFAVDVSAFYQSEEIAYNDFNGRWRGGVNISNIGPKIKYDEAGSENFIPTNFKAGAGFDFILDGSNTIGTYIEFNKLLVPTPIEPTDINGNGEIDPDESYAAVEEYNDINEFGAIFSSWGDAPNGFSEELKEFTYAVGAEYRYADSFAFRLGYFHESEVKGFRQFLTLGAGFRYTTINLDVSYLFSTAATKNPLEGTLRFSLSFNFGDEYDEY
ncbi:MAG TPA: type IX secretion system outer membrane channel protein PorV [Flavobacteriaceae bacterium]|nr:type IX secretion system outer membrane channel protein PorV [Flavobacteriaceae bacterium]